MLKKKKLCFGTSKKFEPTVFIVYIEIISKSFKNKYVYVEEGVGIGWNVFYDSLGVNAGLEMKGFGRIGHYFPSRRGFSSKGRRMSLDGILFRKNGIVEVRTCISKTCSHPGEGRRINTE